MPAIGESVTIERELLWKAWPDGYLAMRGVKTVGGWQCIDGPPGPESLRFHNGRGVELDDRLRMGCRGILIPPLTNYAHHICDEGGLLPDVDPSDAATWACVLLDLANAIPAQRWLHSKGPEKPEWLNPHQMHHFNLSWHQTKRGTSDPHEWAIRAVHSKINTQPYEYAESTTYWHRFSIGQDTDPATALVMARIQLRPFSSRQPPQESGDT